MSGSMHPLDPLGVPLSGVRLIEASAGTGKTYTIAAIYLRLLMERGLDVDRILVVTFTNAATEELRGRVRARIREALAVLEGAAAPDDLVGALCARVPDPAAARRRLQDALTRMDEATVLTIHGFCQRMLQENAFESAALFETELLTDEAELRLGVMEDFWRRELQQAPRARCQWARRRLVSPAGLLAAAGGLLAHPEAGLVPAGEPPVEELERRARRAFETVARRWSRDGAEVVGLLAGHPGLRRAEKTYRPDRLAEAREGLEAWLAEGFSLVPPAGYELFTEDKLRASLKKGATAPEHPFFADCQALADALSALDGALAVALYRQARDYGLRELAARKARRRLLAFDDLLRHLDAALQGPGGEALAERIRERFPVALIDEFQDTDPVQYRIFRRLYGGRAESGLFLIGDPKQAIYGFRGADIFTYMRARRGTDPAARYTLGTNWRSAGRLVEAVNRVFDRADPFLFEPDIGFLPARAGGPADEAPLAVDGAVPEPLQVWLVERAGLGLRRGAIPKGRAEAPICDALAGEAARLIGLGAAGRARVGERALAAGDIAFLVRTRFEAAAVQRALRARGIASVFFSRDSVFDTDEARELALVLRAVAQPADGRALRSALSTSLLGADAPTIHGLEADEAAWERRVQALRGLNETWLRQGFMPMFLALLYAEGVPARLLAGEDGERRVTNLMQLGELLQLASQEREGPERLLRWLADRRAAPDAAAEDQQLRLESDEGLVKVVTIHKSKGLEYPVVFLPFLWNARALGPKVPLPFHDPADRRLRFDLGSDDLDVHRGLAERERLAEDLRLLYVALTRARHQCHLAWGGLNGADSSALAHLLHGGAVPADDREVKAALQALDPEGEGLVALRPLSAPTPGAAPAAASRTGPLAARGFRGLIDAGWRITSYSGLAPAQDPGGAADAERLAETGLGGSEAAAVSADAGVQGFPAGARAGLFLHDLLEHLDFPRAAGGALSEPVARLLDRYGFDAGWQPVVESWMGRVLDTPLDGAGTLRLRDLDARRRRNEMGFLFPLAPLRARDLEAVAPGLGGWETEGGRLEFSPVRGLMKGYIDLVFEHAGRFYLADYKSNRLGADPSDYGPQELRRAMAGHRYDLQYLIYSVALHRYLGGRIPDYRYERHFGGVYYLFLRGMSPEWGSRRGIYFDRPEPELIHALDGLFAGAPRPAGGRG